MTVETCRDCLAGSHEECHEPCRCRDRAHLPETVDLIDHLLQAMIAFVTYLTAGPTGSFASKTNAEWLGSNAAKQVFWRRFDEYAFTTFVHLLGCAAKERQEALNQHGVGTPRASRGCPCDKCGPSASDGDEDDDAVVVWQGTLPDKDSTKVAIVREGHRYHPRYYGLDTWLLPVSEEMNRRIFAAWIHETQVTPDPDAKV